MTTELYENTICNQCGNIRTAKTKPARFGPPAVNRWIVLVVPAFRLDICSLECLREWANKSIESTQLNINVNRDDIVPPFVMEKPNG